MFIIILLSYITLKFHPCSASVHIRRENFDFFFFLLGESLVGG